MLACLPARVSCSMCVYVRRQGPLSRPGCRLSMDVLVLFGWPMMGVLIFQCVPTPTPTPTTEARGRGRGRRCGGARPGADAQGNAEVRGEVLRDHRHILLLRPGDRGHGGEGCVVCEGGVFCLWCWCYAFVCVCARPLMAFSFWYAWSSFAHHTTKTTDTQGWPSTRTSWARRSALAGTTRTRPPR